VRRLKSELKNEEMALVLLKKLKQSQQLPVVREAANSSAAAATTTTSLGGGATLTATRLTGGKASADVRPLQRQTSASVATNDLLNTDKLVSQSLCSTGPVVC
jgi:hypothetical protein